MVFVDSDFFIGLYIIKDAHHKVCLKLGKSLKENLITSWDVIDEVVTKLRYYDSKSTALRFISDIEKQNIPIVYPNHAYNKKARNIFEKQSKKHVSLTDCMNMAIAKEKNIKDFLSFDKIYERNGFKLIK